MSSPISSEPPLRVLIVGGRPAAREAMRALLGAEVDLAPRACAVAAAAAVIARWAPDVVVIDLDGIGKALAGLLIELRRCRPGAALILLGLSEPDVSTGGFPAQSAPPARRGTPPWARVADVLRSVVRSCGAPAGCAADTPALRQSNSAASSPSGATAPGGISAAGVPSPPAAAPEKSPSSGDRPRPEAVELRPDSVLLRLSPRELEVLRHLAQGLTVGQCARRLDLADSTVDNHKARLMRKLGVHRTAELVRIALREGLIKP